jgi:hypothetical protein
MLSHHKNERQNSNLKTGNLSFRNVATKIFGKGRNKIYLHKEVKSKLNLVMLVSSYSPILVLHI